MLIDVVTFNAAELVKLDAGKKAKGVVWTRVRVKAFNVAYEKRLVAERAAPVQPKKPLKRFKVWLATPRPSPVMVRTPVQLGAFLDYAAADRLYALYHLIAFRGLRRGEACGARWADSELDEGLLATAEQLTNVGGEVKEGSPKTESSDAGVALDKVTVAVLRAHKARQNEERLTFAAGLPPIRLHDLRHGAATLSLAAGNDMKTTSAMLPHSSVSITADLYTTVLPEVAREAAEATAVLVPRAVTVGEAPETGGLPSVSQLDDRRPTDSAGSRNPQVEPRVEE
ncbi:site-specific integrase [Nonomuraea sp. NPDC052129]|uniref:site-specific integrase n=1 Tax=Nonomuraea sp. NPDC052129 TaxID=3154651 RepID=UPI0034421CB4